MSDSLRIETGRQTPAAPLPPRREPAGWDGFEYKLLGTDGLAVGELAELLAAHRRAGWEVDRLLLGDEASKAADMTDLIDLGILLRRRRRL